MPVSAIASALRTSLTQRRPSTRVWIFSSCSHQSLRALLRAKWLAVWAARPEIATPELAADFSASLAFGLAHLPEICAEASRELQLPEKELSLYLRTNIDYSLDKENLKGLAEYFARAAGITLVHIPYKGTGPALTDLLGGHIPMAFAPIPAAHANVSAGLLRALAEGEANAV